MVLLAEAVAGFGVMVFDINLNSIMAAVTADDMRSRVAGVFGTINYGARPVGAVIGGLLGSAIGVRPTLLVAGGGRRAGLPVAAAVADPSAAHPHRCDEVALVA